MGGSPEQLIKSAYAAFAARDLEGLVRVADPEIELKTVTGALAGREGPYRGHEGLAQYLADTEGVWTRIELHPQQFTEVDDERVLVFGRTRAWRGHTLIDSPNAWLWTIRGGRVAAVEVFASPAEVPEAFNL